jgi:uncharacterized protein
MWQQRRNLQRVICWAALVLAGVVLPAHAMQTGQSPRNIVVYGGSGAIGSRIVNEALARGHHVTVVDRNPKPLPAAPADRFKLVKGDAFSTPDILVNTANQQALVMAVAVRPAPTADFYVQMVKAAVAAQRAQPVQTKTRLLVVGGASSLLLPDGRRMLDTMPKRRLESARNEVVSMVDALEFLRTVQDTSWTFFSPPMLIQPGKRTGKFRLGADTLLSDAKGVSRISMEDYAVAMLDEIETPQHVNRRFTAAY